MICIVTLKDIFKSVCDHISDVTELPLEDSDTEEPVVRPSFKIFMDTVNTGFYSSGLRQVKVYFNIYFYSSDRKHSKSEIMEIEDKIAFSFLEPFYITVERTSGTRSQNSYKDEFCYTEEECAVYADDLEFEKVDDGIMNCSFNFEIGTEFIDETDIETMEKLETNERLEEF